MAELGTNNGMCVGDSSRLQEFCERHQALLRDLAGHALRSAQQAALLRDLAGHALRSAQQAAQPAAGEVEEPASPPSENTALLTVRVPPEDKKALRRLQLETGRKGPDLMREALRLLLREYGRG